MEKAQIFRHVQEYIESVPVILIGTGGTIPYGIPGMRALAERLIEKLDDKYKENANWDFFIRNIREGKDLESALTDITLSEEMLQDIVIQTWELVNEADLDLFYKLVNGGSILPLAKLLRKLYEPSPQCVNIITTNYDRVIEYACDQIQIDVDKKFRGCYDKRFTQEELKKRKTINLIKVHGSLDLFKDSDGGVHAIPLQKQIPDKLLPEIVTPGENKYRSLLTGEYRDLILLSDLLINGAKSFLCIGYGFNDEQIQRNIISQIKLGKPIVIVTKELSEKAEELIVKNSDKYIIIYENKSDSESTDFLLKEGCITIEGKYWTVEGFLTII